MHKDTEGRNPFLEFKLENNMWKFCIHSHPFLTPVMFWVGVPVFQAVVDARCSGQVFSETNGTLLGKDWKP